MSFYVADESRRVAEDWVDGMNLDKLDFGDPELNQFKPSVRIELSRYARHSYDNDTEVTLYGATPRTYTIWYNSREDTYHVTNEKGVNVFNDYFRKPDELVDALVKAFRPSALVKFFKPAMQEKLEDHKDYLKRQEKFNQMFPMYWSDEKLVQRYEELNEYFRNTTDQYTDDPSVYKSYSNASELRRDIEKEMEKRKIKK